MRLFFNQPARVAFGAVLCIAVVACGGGGENVAGNDSGGSDAGASDAEADGGLQPGECWQASDCDDQLFCNGLEVCDGASAQTPGSCGSGVGPVVDDGIDCTVDSCDEDGDEVVHAPDHGFCDDQVICNGVEQCDVQLGCVASTPDASADEDGDEYTVGQGDCDDCDPLVNPGALELPGNGVDDNCEGTVDEPLLGCDVGLALTDTDPLSGAAAMDLCQQAGEWGIVSANYVRADGGVVAPGLQVGLQAGFGTNAVPQSGASMLLLSTGSARTVGQSGECLSETCNGTGAGSPPPGFPQDVPGCTGGTNINDDIALEITLRAPTNVDGFQFSFMFTSFEYPEWICSNYNDQFIALVSPAPPGSMNGNVAFDSQSNPVSVNIGLFDHCDPASLSSYASNCFSGCPSAPNPYCPNGGSIMDGTGYNEWTTAHSGSSGWLVTQVPVAAGELFTIRFAIWDTGDASLDSSVVIDGFAWLVGNITVGTQPAP